MSNNVIGCCDPTGLHKFVDGKCTRCGDVEPTYQGKTAAQWRAEARRLERSREESWERCDNDGFLSQWASGINARESELKAQVAEKGGFWEFPALFDLDGNLVAAKLIETKFGVSWGVLENDDPRSRVVKWVNRSYAKSAATRNRNMAKKGYAEGTVLARCYVDTIGASYTSVHAAVLRADGGFSRDVEIVATEETDD